ncbi:MAG: SUMF1/EgtB/PvdO family nonheme iron enzyme [Phycisphaerales bacterium]
MPRIMCIVRMAAALLAGTLFAANVRAQGAVAAAAGAVDIPLIPIAPGTVSTSGGSATVTKPFAIAATEITRGQWKAVMKAEPPGGAGTDDLPVASVTWAEAVEFCKRLSEHDHATFRLPTEAEWALACGTSKSATATASAPAAGPLPTSPVGSPAAVRDALGNVSEWCIDWWADALPAGATDPKGPEIGTHRVVRGGSWLTPAAELNCALREKADSAARNPAIGFRVVREDKGAAAPPPGVEYISIERAKSLYEAQTAIFIDARPYAEFVEGHVRNSMHCAVKYFGGAAPAKVRNYLPGNAVVVYCNGESCTDSIDVAVRLKALNLSIGPIYVMKEGLPAWIKAGLPTDKGGEVGFQ